MCGEPKSATRNPTMGRSSGGCRTSRANRDAIAPSAKHGLAVGVLGRRRHGYMPSERLIADVYSPSITASTRPASTCSPTSARSSSRFRRSGRARCAPSSWPRGRGGDRRPTTSSPTPTSTRRTTPGIGAVNDPGVYLLLGWREPIDLDEVGRAEGAVDKVTAAGPADVIPAMNAVDRHFDMVRLGVDPAHGHHPVSDAGLDGVPGEPVADIEDLTTPAIRDLLQLRGVVAPPGRSRSEDRCRLPAEPPDRRERPPGRGAAVGGIRERRAQLHRRVTLQEVGIDVTGQELRVTQDADRAAPGSSGHRG